MGPTSRGTSSPRSPIHRKVLYEAKPKADQGIEKDVATEATEALTEVATSGTGAVVSQLGYPVAGKTWNARRADLKWRHQDDRCLVRRLHPSSTPPP